ncbi:MAG: DNA repair protein RecO [Bacteroidales bacterium]|nr:DNA repair protein RecO [Bacteroidales bacterium]
MLVKTKGIVLHHINYGESSIVVYVYTENFGRQAYIINGVRKSRSKHKLNMFQPLTRLDLDVYYKSNREMHRIKEVKLNGPFHSIPFQIYKSTIAIFIAEILYKTLHEEEKNNALYEFLDSSVQFLDISEKGMSNFHLVFLFQLSKYLGIYPDSDTLNYTAINPELKTELEKIRILNYENLAELQYNQSKRRILLDWIISYYKVHFDGIGSIKSINILKELFG